VAAVRLLGLVGVALIFAAETAHSSNQKQAVAGTSWVGEWEARAGEIGWVVSEQDSEAGALEETQLHMTRNGRHAYEVLWENSRSQKP